MLASELAYKAAEIMSERGHCKHRAHDVEGRVCYMGALFDALLPFRANFHFYGNKFTTVIDVSHELVDERGYCRCSNLFSTCVVEYNNRDDVTGEDIISLFKQTGARLEEKGQ